MEFNKSNTNQISRGHIETKHNEHSFDHLNAYCEFDLKLKNLNESNDLDTKIIAQLNK